VIEDCALAVGARFDGRHVGLFGDAGCFSFYPVKHITTAEGGMFVTRHADVATTVGRLRAFGVDRTYAERTLPGMYDVPMLGLNYRMSEVQAAIGRSQLRRAPQMLAHRQRTFEVIAAVARRVNGLSVIESNDARAASSHYCLTLATDPPSTERRSELVRALNAAGIGTSVHYPQPVPRMTYYQDKYGYDRQRFAGAERISDTTLALPVAPHVGEADGRFIGEAIVRLSEARV
jgi:dTDP-4-amino-4,6-dideoxygalactose transaminase